MNESIRNFWDQDSRSYDMFVEKGFSIKKERRSWQALFTESFGDKKMNILDTGCGPGIVSMQLADLGHDMTSVDFSEKMLEAAKKNAEQNNLKINFQYADAECLPFKNDSFDGVVSDYMLWTVPDPQLVMKEWFRVLRPGGTVAYVDGNWTSDPKRTPFNCTISKLGVFLDSPKKYLMNKKNKHTNTNMNDLWSAKAMRPSDDIKMMENAGFTNITVIHNIQDRVLHGIRHLAYGSTEDHFMIVAHKQPYIQNISENINETLVSTASKNYFQN
ncbi:MAG: methyltransferase domain-containing protein [Candidatus Methanomethylophilaceae archaeon]|nr:methyltransferase domain-containing protein [Candidatus Methanomethylophilaceae archaeon]